MRSPSLALWPSLATALLLLILPQGSHAGGFIHTCKDCVMWNGHNEDSNGHLLRCGCADYLGWYHTTSVHLQERMENINGYLYWTGRGGYRGTCQEFRLILGRWFEARCRTVGGALMFNSFDLNRYVGNINGDLVMDPGVPLRLSHDVNVTMTRIRNTTASYATPTTYLP